MAFKGITFAGQNVSPKNDGGLYASHFGDGILWGCGMTLSGDDLVIQSGEFIACGRVCQVDGATNVDLSTRSLANGYIQVVMDFDVSQPEGNQWNIHLPLIESATTTFPALTKDDINDTGTLYQVQLAIVQIGGGNLTSIYSSMGGSGLVNGGNLTFQRGGTDVGRVTVGASANSINFGKVANGSSVGGMSIDSTDATVIYSGNGLYFRPNGVGDSTGQLTVGTDGSINSSGQITGGHPNTPRTPSGSATLTSSMSNITSLSTGIVSGGVYLVTAECDYTPTTATGHYPQLEIQNGIKNTFYTATAGTRHFLISGIVTGVSSIVFRGTTGTGSTNATVSNIVVNVVRLN